VVGIYLGKRVKDIGKKGLSNAKEFYGIIEEIIEDVERGRITSRTARGRLLLLYRLTYKKNNSNLQISTKTAQKIRNKIKRVMRCL